MKRVKVESVSDEETDNNRPSATKQGCGLSKKLETSTNIKEEDIDNKAMLPDKNPVDFDDGGNDQKPPEAGGSKDLRRRGRAGILTGTDLYQCFECDAKFEELKHIKNHFKQAHRGTKVFGCKFCGFLFRTHEEQSSHAKQNHQFFCYFCRYKMQTEQALNVHMMELHGLRTTTCPVCKVK